MLGPHSAVRAHTGPSNAMLTVQCALAAAPGNWIRVGSEVRPVVQGRCLVFDDSFVHELWNTSPQTRVTFSWRVGHPLGPAKPAADSSRALLPDVAAEPLRAAAGGRVTDGEHREGRHARQARVEARRFAGTLRTVGSTLLAM